MRKQILSFLFILNLFFCAQNDIFGQEKKNETATHQSIRLETDKIFDRLVQVRRKFHENPETAGKEKATQETIKNYLTELGLEVRTGIYGYGVIGILKGAKKGKKIAWRADMDALSNDFPDKVDFKSRIKGVQHGCGHDLHMAIALGIAEVMAKNKKSLHGTLYFIFQPEEETFLGAKKMMENELFSKIGIDEIYGLHVTALPVGQIMVKPNEMYAYQKRIQIALKNKLSNNEITALTNKIESVLFRTQPNSKPWELQQMTDPEAGLSNPNTIFKDYLIHDTFANHSKNDTLFIASDLYETNAGKLKNILPSVRQAIKDSGYADQLLSVSFIRENPTVINNLQLTATAVKTLENIYGKDVVTTDYGQIPFFNDDFAYFQQKIKGVYFLLGGSNLEKGIVAMNHAPNFEVDEECMRTAVKTFSSLLVERVKSQL